MSSVAFHISGKLIRPTVNELTGWVRSATSTSLSPIYTSTATTARVYEQVFLSGTDPRPQTEDWTNFITSFVPSDVLRFKMSASAVKKGSTWESPICRAFVSANDVDVPYSATLYGDGVNTGFDWVNYATAGDYHYYSAETPHWIPISDIVPSGYTGVVSAAVSVYNPFFGGTRAQWQSGGCSALPEGDMLCGAVQFEVGNFVDIPQYSTGSAQSAYLVNNV